MMKSYGLFGFLGLLSLSAVLAVPARAEDSPQVFIVEINWAGSEVSTADEWIELVNLGQTSIDLSHWVLTGTATGGGAIEIAEGTIIEPSHTLLIANYALGDPKTTLLTAPSLVTTALSLPNSSLSILLTTPEGLVIDNYTDSGTPDFGLTDPSTSIERDLVTLLWRSSTQSLNLSSISQLGSPGSVSLPVVMNDEPIEMIAPPSLPMPGEERDKPTQVESDSEVIEVPVVTEPALDPAINPEPCTEVALITGSEAPPEDPTIPLVLVEQTPPALEPVPIAPEIPTAQITSENQLLNTSRIQEIALGDLIINELVSDPTDDLEWVEILNASSSTIDLTGSTLVDAGDHVTSLPAESLAAGSLLVIENPNGNLNNSGDTLTLIDSYGTILDTLTYGTTEIPAPEDGESLARNSDGVWLLASATRNTNNVFPPVSIDEPISEETGQSPVSTANTYDTLPTNVYETLTDEPPAAIINSGTAQGPVATTDDAGATGTEPIHRIVAIAKPVAAGPSPAAT
ncbi:MAG: lamin tail domain-containing protein, partial [Patescibacteria group bacterium]